MSGDHQKESFFARADAPLIIFFMLLQFGFIVLFSECTTYGEEVNSAFGTTGSVSSDATNSIEKYYPFYQDVHVMIFIGFGFLMTFPRRHMFTGVGFTFLLGAFCIQWGILTVEFFHQAVKGSFHMVELSVTNLIAGDFAAGAVLITFGVLLGKVTHVQMLSIAFFELIIYALNEAIGAGEFQAVDMGGSMYVHTFGAVFGLAVSLVLNNSKQYKGRKYEEGEKSSYQSDTFAMIGCIFLWMFWPSFNGALADGNSQHRVVVNTVLALVGSCMATFFMSHLLMGKFDMVHIQNATLAGGVAVGSSSDLVIGPSGAIGIGMVAGFVSVVGYVYFTPFLYKKFGLHDTCGVLNLHGIPGIIGGLGGVISAADASAKAYGSDITVVFAARAYRDAGEQATYQLYALLVTLGLSFVGGLLVGFLVSFLPAPPADYCDSVSWEVPEDYSPVKQAPAAAAASEKKEAVELQEVAVTTTPEVEA